LAKLSGLCSSAEHDACPEHLFAASGKRFGCGCKCHAKVVAKKAVEVDNELDYDYC